MIPEMLLWQAVVNQAFVDSCSSPPIDILDFKTWLPGRRKRLFGKGLEPESEIAEQAAYCRYVRAAHSTVDAWTADRARARKWLLGTSSAFRQVCQLAGYEPEYITRAARRFESQGWNVKPEALAA